MNSGGKAADCLFLPVLQARVYAPHNSRTPSSSRAEKLHTAATAIATTQCDGQLAALPSAITAAARIARHTAIQPTPTTAHGTL